MNVSCVTDDRIQTFCAKCLHRSLDHGSRCPLCRQNLPPFSYFQDHPYNKVILAICESALFLKLFSVVAKNFVRMK